MPTFVEMSGATPPEGYETDGLALLEYLRGGRVPTRDYFYWEFHGEGRPLQAARFGKWKAMRNGINKPVEIYDLGEDAEESKDLAASRPDLVKRATEIFAEAHRPDPEWPLDGNNRKKAESSKEAWEIKRWRDQNK